MLIKLTLSCIFSKLIHLPSWLDVQLLCLKFQTKLSSFYRIIAICFGGHFLLGHSVMIINSRTHFLLITETDMFTSTSLGAELSADIEACSTVDVTVSQSSVSVLINFCPFYRHISSLATALSSIGKSARVDNVLSTLSLQRSRTGWTLKSYK